jgi:competence protein ComEC
VQSGIPIWKEAPFVRIIIPFVLGIVIQFYTNNPSFISYAVLGISLASWCWLSLKPVSFRFVAYHWQGVIINTTLFSAGCIICHHADPFKVLHRISPLVNESKLSVATLTTPALERRSSWKADASFDVIRTVSSDHDPGTNLLIYFRKKDSVYRPPPYGSRIAFSKALRRIENFDGLAGFDYVRYCALKNIHYQVFLAPGDYVVLPGQHGTWLWNFIFRLQDWTVKLLQRYIEDEKACGLALALLIGYKNNLDREIIQAYSNTGVVHVIAISGLHLGIIYSMLRFVCRLWGKTQLARFLSPMIIVAGLWAFSLLAGASPSVLRSAVMFTCIVLGQTGARSTSLINNLAASAFLLLCHDPFWIFDLGFQLSYGALLSIAIFAKPLYNAPGDLSPLSDFIWKINSVTLAAQILTSPILIYQFNQFPNLFLLTNFIAVPASTAILVGEILLCIFSFSQEISSLLGIGIAKAIGWLNHTVQFIDQMPFASSTGLYVNFFQVILCYLFILLVSSWMMLNKRPHLLAALCVATAFFCVPLLKIW